MKLILDTNKKYEELNRDPSKQKLALNFLPHDFKVIQANIKNRQIRPSNTSINNMYSHSTEISDN